jgi:hypothetical protein
LIYIYIYLFILIIYLYLFFIIFTYLYLDVGWPPYAAYITFEIVISKSSNKFFIRTSYLNNDYVIEGCQSYGIWCPLSIFIELLESISLTVIQYKKMCFSNKDNVIDSFFHK